MLIDTFGRQIDYIRVSVTRQCNFRCQYCMPNTPVDFFDNDEYISLDDMFEFLKVAIDEGIKKIRITGGEPLLRKGLIEFITKIHQHNPKVTLALTSNGFLLKKFAKTLKTAGLTRVNISLDSLKKETIIKLSKKDAQKDILEGIEEAINVGLEVKINTVALKNINENEIINLLNFAKNKGVSIRFIEYMENTHARDSLKGLKEDEILSIISTQYNFKPLKASHLGPAKLYKLDNGYVFGVIAPHDDDFCKSCNRIRLTAEGMICPCLYYQDAINAKDSILSKNKILIKQDLLNSIINKPEKNKWGKENLQNDISMRAFYYTGG